ncbi:hypothetical protein ACFFTN_13765 [Aminobacter aganoensis]|uniref:Uncharacterized protein n=1 Tax=Aminobacter aganoensis TaxID=83264 RepID=A0A7X0FCS5_9HYPH|nr:hypothetical protein [Aminobacter aganoensis]MBB6357348.1 hypothetical protein [Aminobacter aganoensis]
MLVSLRRVAALAVTLAMSLGLALAIGLGVADAGWLGTCQDGTCELVALVYVMPSLGVAFYILALAVFSILVIRKQNKKRLQ